MTEERSKRREFLPLVFIVNCFKKPLLIVVNQFAKFFLSKKPKYSKLLLIFWSFW